MTAYHTSQMLSRSNEQRYAKIFIKDKNAFVNVSFHLGMKMYACNLSTQRAEAGGLRVQGQPMLDTDSMS